MIKITFHSRDGFRDSIKEVEKLNAYQKSAIRNAGEETAREMRVKIKNSKVRPQAGESTDLEDAIDVKHFESVDEIGWGVGEIAELDKQAPYWRAVNYGSSHLVGKRVWGHFSPGDPVPNRGSEREGRMVHHSRGIEPYYPIHITKPIPPMNYISHTVKFINKKVKYIVKNLVPNRIFRR